MLNRMIELLKAHQVLKPATKPLEAHPSLELRFSSYTKGSINQFANFAVQYFRHLDVPTTEPIKLKTLIQRWTVLKSPHVHKTAFSQFERRTSRLKIQVCNLPIDLVNKSLAYLQKHKVDGVWFDAKIIEYEKM